MGVRAKSQMKASLITALSSRVGNSGSGRALRANHVSSCRSKDDVGRASFAGRIGVGKGAKISTLVDASVAYNEAAASGEALSSRVLAFILTSGFRCVPANKMLTSGTRLVRLLTERPVNASAFAGVRQ